jgi:hypothetical protein
MTTLPSVSTETIFEFADHLKTAQESGNSSHTSSQLLHNFLNEQPEVVEFLRRKDFLRRNLRVADFTTEATAISLFWELLKRQAEKNGAVPRRD